MKVDQWMGAVVTVGGLRPMARRIGCSYELVRGWVIGRAVPSQRWIDAMLAARREYAPRFLAKLNQVDPLASGSSHR